MAGSSAALPTGVVLSGVFATLGGALVARLSWRRGTRMEGFRLLLSLAATVWGVGQLMLGVQLIGGPADFPAAGDIVSMLAAPLAVAGLLRLPRRTAEPQAGLRLGLEALMIGAAGQMVLWRFWFRGPRGVPLDGGDLVALAILSCELLVLALLLVCAVRDTDRGVVVACTGLGTYVAGELLTTHAAPGAVGEHLGWVGAAVSCVVWPVILLGILAVDARPSVTSLRAAPRAELRRSVVTSVAVLLPMMLFMYGLLLDGYADPVSLALGAGVVIGFAGREVVRGRQAHALLDRLAEQAHRDPLTGLGNRRALTSDLDRLRSTGTPAVVLTLDVDRFKEVNGQLGHSAGDAVLVEVARAMDSVCQSAGARSYRLGGDEFAILSRAGLGESRELAERVRHAVRVGAAAVPGLGRIVLTGSVGLAVVKQADGHGSGDPLRALTESIEALRFAKLERNRVWVYDEALAEQARRRATMERRLALAVETRAIEMHFQPIVQLATGRVTGIEALARWRDADLGVVAPDVFIALAEQTGLIHGLGRLALEQSIAMLATPAAAELKVGVNVSPLQLRDPGFVTEVAAILHRYSVEPRRLVLEVTEGIFVDPNDRAVHALRELSALGVVIAIDDFGEGYSSWGYLDRLPADILKIDRRLTGQAGDARTMAVIRAIVDMASALGLDAVVEGVETPAAATSLLAMGAEFAQGWLYSAAVPAAELPAVLRRLRSAQRDLDQPVVAGTRAASGGVVRQHPQAFAVGGDHDVA